jgi:predicted PurR-regulated permease PerM
MQTEARPFYFRVSMILFMLLLICIFLYYGSDIIVPFALAILLSILLVPVNRFLERKGIGRINAIVISLAIACTAIFGVLYFLSTQILAFLDDIPEIRRRIGELIFTVQKWLQERFGITVREQTAYLNDATENGSGIIGTTFISLKDTFLVITLLPIYSFLILYYRDMLKKFVIDIFRNSDQDKVEEVLRESRGVIQNYMVGLIIEMGIVAIINFIGFFIIGIEYAIFLAVFAAIMNLIPYIGMLIASIFCAVVTLTSSTDVSDAIWVLVVLWVVQFIDNNILMPRIVGSKVKINALITILGVLIGGALCGIPGTFLSIPGIAILKVIFERVDELKPWGMLMSDDITAVKPGRIYTRITSIRRKPYRKKAV